MTKRQWSSRTNKKIGGNLQGEPIFVVQYAEDWRDACLQERKEERSKDAVWVFSICISTLHDVKIKFFWYTQGYAH